MLRIFPIVFLLGVTSTLLSQNPHGESFKIDCAACHSPEGWEIAKSAWENGNLVNPYVPEEEAFSHDQTDFPLTGQHGDVDCLSCHESLAFTEASTDCISCHTDLHQMTVGSDCARCHSTENWLVDDVLDLHVQNGFPLLGNHAIVNCQDCHTSETFVRFDRIGNDCINCHLDEYMATTSPDHQAAGYSLDCMECHDPASPEWLWSEGFANHSFFPLEKGHDTRDCAACHINEVYTGTPTDCFACHQSDFEVAVNPNHQILGFSTDCAACHTIDPGWMPAEYSQHDSEYFPIYSGSHKGEWDECTDCHTNPSDFSVFSCTVCHGQSETNGEHNGVSGYVYESTMCLVCHPTGNEDGAFNHDNTGFPLTGAHDNVDCASCHADGFAGTPTECSACHLTDFQQTTSPDHETAGFPTDCALCHNSEPGWAADNFTQHDNEYFPIYSGKHEGEWNECSECHTTAGSFTAFSCIDCHEHNNANELADDHDDVQDYQFNSQACYECHPTGEE